MKCPECGVSNVRREDDGRNILIFCGKCGFVIDDEIIVI
jgi:transcription initiation factor TFIIIB Brf1 subunit/transcription initiation factor TFIIB